MLTSHELARLLLKRRDNDVVIELVHLHPTDDEASVDYSRTTLIDNVDVPEEFRNTDVVEYDTRSDTVIIRAGISYCPFCSKEAD